MPDLSPYTGQVGVLVGAIIGFLAQWVNGKRQFDLERLRQQQARRTARYDRLLATYETVLGVSLTVRDATLRLIALADDETRESRDAELAGLFERVTADLQIARVRLLIHSETARVREVFEDLLNLFNELRLLERDKHEGDRRTRSTDLGNKRKEIFDRLTLLTAAIRISLEQLEPPPNNVAPPWYRRFWRRVQCRRE
jgi:hypothetical protein